MHITHIIAAAALAAPTVALANGFENSNFVTAYVQDFENTTPFGVGGRFGITPSGMIVADAVFSSVDEDIPFGSLSTSSTGIRVGYRHSFADLGGNSAVFSLGGGLSYSSFKSESEIEVLTVVSTVSVDGSETDFYVEGDVELPVGQRGVAHAVATYANSDFNFGGGYSYYFTDQLGVRAELVLDGPIELGVAFRF